VLSQCWLRLVCDFRIPRIFTNVNTKSLPVTRPKIGFIQLPIRTLYHPTIQFVSVLFLFLQVSKCPGRMSITLGHFDYLGRGDCVAPKRRYPYNPLTLRHVLDEQEPQLHRCWKSHFVVHPGVRVLNLDFDGSTQRFRWE
jgi:hypothetical protein